jgi:hypothetical protein
MFLSSQKIHMSESPNFNVMVLGGGVFDKKGIQESWSPYESDYEIQKDDFPLGQVEIQ